MLERFKEIVAHYYNGRADATDHASIGPEDVYVVWSCKTLQNWKALLSTPVPDGMCCTVARNAASVQRVRLHAPAALPSAAGVGGVAHEAEVADLAALAERLRADEVGVGQAAVVDDVRVAAHGSELQEAALAQDLGIDALVALESELVLGPALMPGVGCTAARKCGQCSTEKRGVDWLLDNGISPTIPLEDPNALANIDLVIWGQDWEMKNVTNSHSSAKSQLDRAKEKWRKLGLSSPVRAVITLDGCVDGFDEVIDSLERKGGYSELLVVSKDRLFRIKK